MKLFQEVMKKKTQIFPEHIKSRGSRTTTRNTSTMTPPNQAGTRPCVRWTSQLLITSVGAWRKVRHGKATGKAGGKVGPKTNSEDQNDTVDAVSFWSSLFAAAGCHCLVAWCLRAGIICISYRTDGSQWHTKNTESLSMDDFYDRDHLTTR